MGCMPSSFEAIIFRLCVIMIRPSPSNRHNPRRGGDVHDLKLMVWNVRGAGNRHFLNELKEHLREYKPQVLAILETHISGNRADEVCQRSGFDIWHRVEAQGFQGGIWLLWDSLEFAIEVVRYQDQFITEWMSGRQSVPWLFTAVYASHTNRPKNVSGKTWNNLELRSIVLGSS